MDSTKWILSWDSSIECIGCSRRNNGFQSATKPSENTSLLKHNLEENYQCIVKFEDPEK